MSAAPASSGAPVRVWLVEDEVQFRETLAFLVDHTSGMQCAQAFEDGEAALSMLEAIDAGAYPDVVLMDVNLPGLSGIDCTSTVKARLPEVPIVMLTIRDDAETIFEAFRAGASGYLLKDSPVDKIIAAIREALEGGMPMPAPVARRVLNFFAQPTPARRDYGLSKREKEVLEQMVEGLSQKEIGARLFISAATVNAHIQHIYQKLHVHSSSAAVAKAMRERIV